MNTRALLNIALPGVVCVAILAGCNPQMAPVPAPPSQPSGESPQASTPFGAQPAMEGEMTLNLFAEGDATEETRGPSFTVKSPSCRRLPEGPWAFENAVATIDAKGESPDITLKAGRGVLDHETDQAKLEGGVEVQAGKMSISLSDIEWQNAKRTAVSQNPVTIISGETQLQASSMELQPDTKVLTLTDVTGTLVQEGLVEP